MEDLFFWKNWKSSHRLLVLFFLSLSLLSIVFLLAGWTWGIDAVISWSTGIEYKTVQTSVDSFMHNLVNYNININTFLINEKFEAGPIEVNPLSSYLFLLMVTLGFILLLTAVTYLDIFWFGLGLAFFLVFLATMKTELLSIFGMQNRTTLVIAIFTFLGVSYYFQSFKPDTALIRRFLIFAVLIFLYAVVIAIGSSEENPFLYLANFSTPVPIIISILFMALVGYDLIFVFLYLVTGSRSVNSKGRLMNFVVISLLYLFNLFAALSEKLGIWDLDIIFINPFFIYLLSSICGLWVFRQKLKSTPAMSFRPSGALYYLACLIISNAVIALAFITGNDPMVDMFEYFIIYTHLAFGLIFFFYVLINFGDFFSKNVSIYKVVYKPTRSPYFIMQGISFVIILALFLNANRFPYELGMSGYYNLLGDVFAYQGEETLAEGYYMEGRDYAFQNHRSNYSLALLALKKGDQKTAQLYLTRSLIRTPSDYAYAQLSDLYDESNMYFPSVFMLQDGMNDFPENGYLANNLGLKMQESRSLDSAFIYLNMATSDDKTEKVAAVNILSFLTINNLYTEADSLAESFSFDNDLAYQNNLLITNKNRGSVYNKPFLSASFKDSLISSVGFPYIYNYGLKNIRVPSDSVIQLINKLSKIKENQDLSKHLDLIKALNMWYTGSKFDAIRLLDLLKNSSDQTSPYFSKVLGMLFFKQREFVDAARYLQEAHQNTDQEAMLFLSIANLETGNYGQAINILNQLKDSELEDIQLIANNLLMVLAAEEPGSNWDDALKYQFLYYHFEDLSPAKRLEIFNEIEASGIKTLAGARIIESFLETGSLSDAEKVFEELPESESKKDYVSGEMNLQKLKLWSIKEQWDKISKLSPDIFLNDYAKQDAILYQAKALSVLGDSSKAEDLYQKGLKQNPFNEYLNLFAAEFYLNKGNNDMAYEILVTGLELHPNSVPLFKAYIKLAYKMNLIAFAEDAIQRLKELADPSDFKSYMNSIKDLSKPNIQ